MLDVPSRTSLFHGVLNANVVPKIKLAFHFLLWQHMNLPVFVKVKHKRDTSP